ncbi:MAG TPA: hypothetical protein VNX00_16230 [Herbaspirillum sp.]|nr:hypothetical protein [Herbaspirillum sp.]
MNSISPNGLFGRIAALRRFREAHSGLNAFPELANSNKFYLLR